MEIISFIGIVAALILIILGSVRGYSLNSTRISEP